jgi:hypothetical protein
VTIRSSAKAANPAQIEDAAYRARRGEAARFTFNWLSATGTAILFAAIATAFALRLRASIVIDTARATLRQMLPSLATIALMLALGFVTRYGGTDATLGLAFTQHGRLLSVFRHAARLARRGHDRVGHQLERALRQLAEDHRDSSWISVRS